MASAASRWRMGRRRQKMVAGTPLWIGAEKHAVENVGKTKVEVIVVELKGRK